MPNYGETRRQIALATGGMVATAHPLATSAGLDVLRRGGNAMDAAVAAALTTAVVLPSLCGLGGDAFLIHYSAGDGRVHALNGSGISSRRADWTYFTERGYQKMPYYGPLSVAVPGAVDAYFTAIERFGSLPMAELFEPAIHYAAHGFPLSPLGSRVIATAADRLREYPTSAAILLPVGNPPAPGTILRQPDLARSLGLIATQGPDVFYRGEIAERIARFMAEAGGLLTVEDFADHQSDVYEPLQVDYRGHTVYETGLPTQGHIVLEELNIIGHADLAAMGHNSADAIHLMTEAKKRAFADRLAYSADPRFRSVPLETLLSVEFARQRFDTIDMARASDVVTAGHLSEQVGDTTYLCVIDGQGNGVSFIQSLSASFGSQVIAGDTGILLNNRAGRGFTLEPDHPNVIEPGKRTMHTLNCYLVTQAGQLRWVGGTPGGDQQPQWNMQVLTNLIDYGMDVQQAVETPRWQSFPGTDPINLPNDFVLYLEDRIGTPVAEELVRRGHRVQLRGAWAAGGSAQLIERNPESGVLSGGSDPRTDGAALGY